MEKILNRESEQQKTHRIDVSIQKRADFVINNIKGTVLDLGCVGGDYQRDLNTTLSPLHIKINQGSHFFTIGLDLNV